MFVITVMLVILFIFNRTDNLLYTSFLILDGFKICFNFFVLEYVYSLLFI